VVYTISVDKRDPQDRIYMHITGRNGNTSVFSGTDILSETGVTSGYQQYTGNFDFAGSLNRLVVEVGGRDINLAIGPLFDDVSINVLYNVVNTIVTQEITTVEMFVALNTDVSTEILEVVETIFEFNEPIQDAPVFTLEPINDTVEDFSYETVEVELEVDFDMEVEMTEVEINVEPETEEPTMDIQEAANEEPDMENSTDSEPNETESDSEATEESPVEDESSDEQETVQQEEKQEPTEEPKQEVKQEQKQKAATKIVKKMGDKGRYEVNNQIKTLIVMQVLANSKSFFVDTQLSEIQGFFTDVELPDTTISDNNIANYFMTIDSDNTFNQIVDSQYNR